MNDQDKALAARLAEIFTAQDLDYITDILTEKERFTTNPDQKRVEDIIWLAWHNAVANEG